MPVLLSFAHSQLDTIGVYVEQSDIYTQKRYLLSAKHLVRHRWSVFVYVEIAAQILSKIIQSNISENIL